MEKVPITPTFILLHTDCANENNEAIRKFRKNFGEEMDLDKPLSPSAIMDTHWICLAKKIFEGKSLKEFLSFEETLYKEYRTIHLRSCGVLDIPYDEIKDFRQFLRFYYEHYLSQEFIRLYKEMQC